ncbi:MAG: DNA polymerase III, subunit gamma and tau [Chloroflexi bacterium RBG_16_48_8]|nr:MAG: DNA polymerase III, subunit gamma and tau [Chloroflexi bacterium RBG_16_48_8]
MSQALYLRWRPKTWDEVVGQEHVIQTLRNAVRSNRVAHAYLFAGPRGTGKTTTARLLAKAVNCLSESLADRPDNQCAPCQAVNEGRFLDLIEIDAASNTSVEDVRDLRDKINFLPNEGRYKVYIIDEVHMLSTAAFNALLKTLEEPPAHAIFILATTEVHKIPATVLSRCQRHEFRRLPVKTILEFLSMKSETENLPIDPQALELIARQATGSLRDGISLLDQLTSTGDHVTLEQAQMIFGTVAGESVGEVVQALIEQDPSKGFSALNRAIDGGADPRQFARQIVDYLRGMLMIKMGNAPLVDGSADIRIEMSNLAERVDMSYLLLALKTFNQAAMEKRSSWIPGLALELAFLETSHTGHPPMPGSSSSHMVTPPISKPSSQMTDPQEPTEARSRWTSSWDQKPQGVSLKPSSDMQSDRMGEISFQEIRGRWREILHAVRQYDPRTQALLNSCVPIGVEEDTLVLGFRSDLLRDKMEKDHNILKACQAAEKVLGKPILLRCVLTSAWRSEQADEEQPPFIEEGGMVATAIKDFGAQVVDIEQLPPDTGP